MDDGSKFVDLSIINLKTLEKHLTRSIFITGLVGFIFMFTVHRLIYNTLHSQHIEQTKRDIDSAFGILKSDLAITTSAVASSKEFLDFMQLNPDGRMRTKTDIKRMLDPYVKENGGISVVDKSGRALAVSGMETSNIVSFNLCYLNGELDAKNGTCIGKMKFYLDTDYLYSYLKSINSSINECKTCPPIAIASGIAAGKFVIGSESELESSYEIPVNGFQLLYGFEMLTFLAVLFFGVYVRIRTRKIIRIKLIEPIDEIVENLKNNKKMTFPKAWLAEFKFLAERIDLWRDRSEAIEQIKREGELNKCVAMTAQMFAHDVKKPLSLLKTGLDQLTNIADPATLRIELSELKSDVSRVFEDADDMIQDVLQIGKDIQIETSEHSLNKIFMDSIGSVFKMIGDERLKFTFNLNHSYKVNVDDVKIRRVIGNLLINAAEAMDYNGRIVVVTGNNAVGRTNISIWNSGPDVPKGILNSMFDAFETYGKSEGTGLGLAICKKIINAHGGEINCYSTGDGVGFLFSLSSSSSPEVVMNFPATAAEIASDRAIKKTKMLAPIDSDTRFPKIAFIEDGLIIRKLWEKKFKYMNLHTFEGPDDFLSRNSPAAIKEFSCIITDYYFGDKNCEDFVEKVRKVFNGPVFVCTDGPLRKETLGKFSGMIPKEPPNDYYIVDAVAKWQKKTGS